MCNVSLKSILKSDTLYLDRVYDVKDRTQGDLNTSVTTKHWPVLGKLQVGRLDETRFTHVAKGEDLE